MEWFRRTGGVAGVVLLLAVIATGGALAAQSHTPIGGASPPIGHPGPLRGPHGGRRPLGVSGIVVGLSTSGFTLQAAPLPPNSTGTALTQAVQVSSTTGYSFAPGLSAAFGDLQSGERVTVEGTVYGNGLVAREVHLDLPGVRGKVTGRSEGQVSIIEPDGRTATIVTADAADVAVGQIVEGFGSWQGDTLLAKSFRVMPDRVGGVVKSVVGNTATIEEPTGQTVAVQWNGSTVFAARPGKRTTASEVTQGVRLNALGTWQGTTLQASRVDVDPTPTGLGSSGS